MTLIAATRALQARGRPPRSTNSPPRPAPLGRDSGLAYFAPLDGMRGLAVLLVFGGHFAATWFPGALFALDVLFVLSGYFVTRLLLLERERYGALDLRVFYVRRALRVLPALFVVVAVLTCLAVLLPPRVPSAGPVVSAAWSCSYIANWFAGVRFPSGAGYLAHTWTISVEEQFYFLGPAALILFCRRGRAQVGLIRWALLLAVASIASRTALFVLGQPSYAFYFTPARLDGLMLGAATAIALADPGLATRLHTLCGRATGAALLLLGAGAVVGPRDLLGFTWWRLLPGVTAAGLLTVVVVIGLQATPHSATSRVLSGGPLATVGRASYSLYLVHFPVALVLIAETGYGPVGRLVVGLPATAALGALLHLVVERPALRLRARLPAATRRPAPAPHRSTAMH